MARRFYADQREVDQREPSAGRPGYKIANESLDGRGPFDKVRWSDGVTEGGSSGSGLFTVGSGSYQLYGGCSFCSAPSDPDYYSRLSDLYSSLQPYLAP